MIFFKDLRLLTYHDHRFAGYEVFARTPPVDMVGRSDWCSNENTHAKHLLHVLLSIVHSSCSLFHLLQAIASGEESLSIFYQHKSDLQALVVYGILHIRHAFA